jgi:hypothetical protein
VTSVIPGHTSFFLSLPRLRGRAAASIRERRVGGACKITPPGSLTRATSPFRGGIRSRRAPSPVFFAAPGRPSFRLRPSGFRLCPHGLRRTSRRTSRPLSERTEGARDARVRTDPRASTPRDIEACRSPNCRKSAKSQGVPRAVFEVCSAPSPVVVRSSRLTPSWGRDTPPFQASALGRRCFDRSPAYRPGQGPSACGKARQDKARLGPPVGLWRRISDAPDRPPLPAPRLETLIRHPSVTRDGMAV